MAAQAIVETADWPRSSVIWSNWCSIQILAAAKAAAPAAKHAAKSDPLYIQAEFKWSNPNRSLGRKGVISVDPVVATQNNTANGAQHNGQPAFGDDDFFNHY